MMQLPVALNGVMCEDVRPEGTGKASLMGYLGVLPNVNMLVANLSAPIARVTFVVSLSQGEGQFSFLAKVLSPSGQNMIHGEHSFNAVLHSKFFVNIAIACQNLILPVPGVYRFQLWLDDSLIYDEGFNVIQGLVPTQAPYMEMEDPVITAGAYRSSAATLRE